MHGKRFIRCSFREIDFRNCEIRHLGDELELFQALEDLDVSHNKLRSLQFLPHGLQVLNAYGNKIDSVALQQLPVREEEFTMLAAAAAWW